MSIGEFIFALVVIVFTLIFLVMLIGPTVVAVLPWLILFVIIAAVIMGVQYVVIMQKEIIRGI